MEITVSKGIFKKSLSVFMALLIAMSTMWMGLSVVEFSVGAVGNVTGGNVTGGNVQPSGSVISSGKCGSNVYYYLYENGVVVISGSGAVYSSAFYRNYSIKHIIIEDGVTTIGYRAFYYCSNLKTLTLGKNLRSIESYAFYGCTIRKVYAHDISSWLKIHYNGVDSIPTRCGATLYLGGETADEIVIPKGFKTIRAGAFYNCDNIKKVTIPDSVTKINSYAFYSLNKLESIDLPKNLTSIGNYAFYNCYTLKELTIPDSVTSIGYRALSTKYRYRTYNIHVNLLCNKDSYAESYAINNGFAYVLLDGSDEENIFSGTIGKRFTWTIDRRTGVFELEGSGKMPDFDSNNPAPWEEYNKYIHEVKLPDGLENISSNAFKNANRIREVVIPNSVTDIGAYAFYNCFGIKKLTIGNNVTSIGNYAFYNCDKLTEVTISDSVTYLGSYVFYHCKRLKDVVIGDGVTSIGSYAFYHCEKLKSISIGDSVRNIDELAFYECNNVKKVYINDLESWLKTSFEYDRYYGNYYLSNPLYYGADLYLDGKLVTDIVVPEGITSIEMGAFYNYKKLESITITDSVTAIASRAFYNCDGLRNVTIPEGVTGIGDYTFAECDNLKSVELPSTVNFASSYYDEWDDDYYSYTRNYIFNNCKSLETVKFNVNENYESKITNIPSDTFTGCSSLKEIILPASVKVIESNSFPSTLRKITILNPNCNIDSNCGIAYNSEVIGFKGSTAEVFADKKAADFTDYETVHTHSYKKITDTKPTCTEDGLFLERCSCGKENKEVRAKTGHEFKDFEVTLEPTCTSYGEKKAFCKNCDHYEMQRIQPTYHPNRESRAQQNPTCTSYGYTSGVYCPDCETWLSGHVRIDTAGHSFTEKIIDDAHFVSAATAVSPAIYRYDCANCDTIGSATFTHGSALGLGKTSEITASQTTSSIKLTWKPVEEAKGYIIFTWVNGSWEACAIANGTSYNFTNLKSGTKYKLAVVAYGTSNGFISMAPDFTTIETYTKAALPKITVKSDASSIKLTWNKVTGADGYRVYYKSGSSWKTLKTTTGTSYTLKNIKAGTKYTFAVKPYIDTENGKLWSSYKTVVAATTPANPTAKVTAPSKGKLTLSWKAVNGAESYQVYYKTGNGSYKLYKTYSGVKTINFKNLKSGTKYTFAVRAVINTTAGSVRSGYKAVSVTVK